MRDTGHPVSLVRPACGPGWAREDHMQGQVAMFTSAGTQPLAPQELLGSPVVSGGYLYLSASPLRGHCRSDLHREQQDAVYLARVSANPAAWATRPAISGTQARPALSLTPPRPSRYSPPRHPWPSTLATSPPWASIS